MTQFKISDYETIKNAMVNRDLKQALYDEGKVIMDGVLLTLHGEEPVSYTHLTLPTKA